MSAPWSSGAEFGSELTIRGLSASTLIERFGSPLIVVDEADFRERAASFRDAFAVEFAAAGFPGCEVYYAGKSFLSKAIARWVHDEGLGLDVCTGGELAVAVAVDFPVDRIAMHGNNKSDAELRAAVELGVGRVVVDSLDEIDRLATIAAAAGTTVAVLVRVTTGVHADTHEFVQTAHEDQKFGLSIATGAAYAAVLAVTDRAQSLSFHGIHSHIGSQILDPAGYAAALGVVGELLATLAADGIDVPHLDIGGGFGIQYVDEHVPAIGRWAAELAQAAADRIPVSVSGRRPIVCIEPGRAIVGPSAMTLYTVGTVKDVEAGDGPRRYLSVDGGMSDNIRPALYGARYSAALASRESAALGVRTRVVGKHCESGDILVSDVSLAGDITSGDVLAVAATGAYTYAMASNYNHVPRPAVVAVDGDGIAKVIIRRETSEDVLARDVG